MRARDGKRHGLLGAFIAVLAAVALFTCGFWVGAQWKGSSEPKISATTIETQIVDCSDLATSKLEYNGLVRYAQGDIPLINAKAFTMVYTAEVRAGVDLSQAKVYVEDKHITVVLPQATVQSVAIDPDSLHFYDSTWALFNWENKGDTAQALIAAQEDVASKVDQTSMISKANDQAVVVVTNLLAPFTDSSQSYTLDVKQA